MSALSKGVSRETLVAIDQFLDLVAHWGSAIRLVGPGDRQVLWTNHVEDSLALSHFLETGQVWLDLGSGAGFPICILAISARWSDIDAQFHAVESDKRKAAFLKEVARRLNLSLTVHACRIEDAPKIEATHVSAKALADVETLLGFSRRFSNRSLQLLFLKGRKVHEELDRAALLWTDRYNLKYMEAPERGYILIVEEFSRA